MKSRIFFLIAMLFLSVATLEAGEFIKTHFSGYVEDCGNVEVTLLWKWLGDTTGIRFEVYLDLGTNDVTLLDIASTDKHYVYRDPQRGDTMVSVVCKTYNLDRLADRLPVSMTFLIRERGGHAVKMFDGFLMAPPRVTTLVGADRIDWSWSIDDPPMDVFYRVVGYVEGRGQILESEYININSFIWNREEWENHTGKPWPNWFGQISSFCGDVRAIVVREEFQSIAVSQKLYFVNSDVNGDKSSLMPLEYGLSNNYPNPFNPTTQIEYSIPTSNPVSIEVCNALGQKIKTLVNRTMSPGKYQAIWNGTDNVGNAVPSGVYYCQMKSSHFNSVKKMLLIK